MRRKRTVLGKAALMLFAVLILYTIWDNNRIKITRQEIALEYLPQPLHDFTILQITDLHEKEFGKDQSRLIKAINAIDYDAIVFTGDMLAGPKSSNAASFYTLLEGIENKDRAFYVPGNSDPYSYRINSGVEKSAFIKGMEKRGVSLLESIASVKLDGAEVHFVHFELAIIADSAYIGKINGTVHPPYASEAQYVAYQAQKMEELAVLDEKGPDQMVIALNHYPVPDARVDYIKNDPYTTWRDFDLIIAGHYHGGQIRLPFIGAIFIPDPWYEPNSFFPPEDRVRGLWEYGNTKQYVSSGLGNSEAFSFSAFRLFNPPEINVLQLKRASSE